MKTRGFQALVASLLTLVLAGCSTFYDIHFMPAPIEVRISDGDDPARVARALVAVRGVRRPDQEHAQAARFELKMRVENLGQSPVQVEPESFELVAADLQSCGTPQIVQAIDHELATGEALDLDIFVPLPAGKAIGDYDLRGLNLKWAVRFGDRRVTTGVSFQRYVAPPYYYYDPFYPSWGWRCSTHVGVGAFHAY